MAGNEVLEFAESVGADLRFGFKGGSHPGSVNPPSPSFCQHPLQVLHSTTLDRRSCREALQRFDLPGNQRPHR